MKTLKKVLKWVGIIFLIIIATGFTLYLIYLRPVMKKMEQTSTIPYDKDLTIILGGGGNSGVLVSDSLVIVVDTKMGDAAKELADKVKELAGNKPILVINTHDHPDHIEGNKYYTGQTIMAGGDYTEERWKKEASEETMPNKWLKGKMDIKMGDDTVTVFNLGRYAHTASDVFVYLHKKKMLFGGDIILNQQAPAILGDASVEGYWEAFNTLPKQFDIQKIVPGHGPMGGIEILDNFRQYFIDMDKAAKDDSQRAELVAKYKDWMQVPILASPGATISAIKKQGAIK